MTPVTKLDPLVEDVIADMPDGMQGFLKSWGFNQFATALRAKLTAHQAHKCLGHSDGQHVEDMDGSCLGKDCTFRFRSAPVLAASSDAVTRDSAIAAIEHVSASNELLDALELAAGVANRVIAATGFDESQVADWRPPS